MENRIADMTISGKHSGGDVASQCFDSGIANRPFRQAADERVPQIVPATLHASLFADTRPCRIPARDGPGHIEAIASAEPIALCRENVVFGLDA